MHGPVVDGAWRLQTELTLRLGVRTPGIGLLEEVLTTMDAVAREARSALIAIGPGAEWGPLLTASSDLTRILDEFSARWAEPIAAHQRTRPAGTDPVEHMNAWDQALMMRLELQDLAGPLAAVAAQLGEITGADLEPDLSR